MVCKALFWQLMKIGAFCLLITFIPGIPPHASYVEYSVKRPHRLDTSLASNKYLNGAQHLFEGGVLGPEAFATFDGAVYTGVHGGYVVRIDENALTPIVKFGKSCEDITEEQTCGRPLGMKFDQHGNLFVADAYYGIYKYNLKKGEITQLVSSEQEIEGKKSTFINDVAVASDGAVYFTVTSTTFPLFEGVQAMLAFGDGRLIKYDPQTGKSKVLVEGMLFPNGIAISRDDEYLVISESVGLRVMKYHLKGSKKNSLEVFAESLPGLPDNIRSDGNDGFYVSLVVPADESHPALPQVLAAFPNIRRFLGRLLFLLEFPFVQINELYPNLFCKRAAHLIGHFSTTTFMFPHETVILQLDSSGKIKDALTGDDGSISHVSDIIVLENDILLGSPYNNFIGRVPRPNAPHRVYVKSVRYEKASEKDTMREDTEDKAKSAEEEAAKKVAQEAKIKNAAEEAAKRAAEEVKAKRAAEEVAKRAAEEAKAKRAAEEAAKRAAEEVKAKRAAEEAAKRAAEEVKAKKVAEEAAKKAEEAKMKKAAMEAAQRAAEEAKLRKAAEEEAKRAAAKVKARKAAEEDSKKQEEIRIKKVAEEAQQKADQARRASEQIKQSKADEARKQAEESKKSKGADNAEHRKPVETSSLKSSDSSNMNTQTENK